VSDLAANPADGDLWRHRVLYMLSWENFDTAIQSIAAQLRAADERVDCILGISRGGLVPAVALSNVLSVPEFHVVAVGRNVGTGRYLDKQPPKMLWRGNLDAVRGRRVLVIDDVAGTGETLRYVCDQVTLAGAGKVRSTVVVKMQQGNSVPDFFAVELDDWVVFPWEDSEVPASAQTRPVVIGESGQEEGQ
jgi:hypoxanthine phosphoribosyltransferase